VSGPFGDRHVIGKARGDTLAGASPLSICPGAPVENIAKFQLTVSDSQIVKFYVLVSRPLSNKRKLAAMSNKQKLESLHDKARRAIAAGVSKFREAADYLAEARKQGATQRQSAVAVGRSQRWVNALLQWRQNGYKGAPFEKRKRPQRDTPTIQKNRKPRPPMTTEQAEVERAKAEAQRAKAEFQRARAEVVARMFGPPLTKTIPNGAREELIKALGLLGSSDASERASAAFIVERCRARLNLEWGDLIIPAEAESAAVSKAA